MRPAHASRAQAVFETALVLPVFLVAFFALLWAMRDSSLAERVQLGVRYTGLVQSLADPYASFSLYTMYATIDNNAPREAQACFPGTQTVVTQGHTSFWQPSRGAWAQRPPVAACGSFPLRKCTRNRSCCTTTTQH